MEADHPSPGAASAAEADEERAWEQFLDQFEWTRDGAGQLGAEAEIRIPAGFQFTNGADAMAILQGMGNLIDTPPEGLIGPEGLDWFVVFFFDAAGYVKDDEKDELDADALFAEKKEIEKISNEHRRAAGLETLTMTGWAKNPFYNQETNNLEWGVVLQSSGGGENINYQTKLLGRNGFMDVTLVCGPEDLDAVLPQYQDLLTGFSYTEGNRYAEFRDGDKLAEYGLTALVVGGAAALGAKAGLFAVVGKFFAKAWKLIVLGVVGIGVALKKFFGFGKHTYARDRD
ncbi:DUF2167 domain-containing protein [soil metagenome]